MSGKDESIETLRGLAVLLLVAFHASVRTPDGQTFFDYAAYSLRFVHDVFFNGEPIDLPRTPHEPPRWMKLPVEILVVICLAVGILPAWTFGPLLASAAAATSA